MNAFNRARPFAARAPNRLEALMNRRWILIVMLSVFAMSPLLQGCHHDNDDKTKVEIDTKGSHKGVTVDKD
jgi:hypothetical protein